MFSAASILNYNVLSNQGTLIILTLRFYKLQENWEALSYYSSCTVQTYMIHKSGVVEIFTYKDGYPFKNLTYY